VKAVTSGVLPPGLVSSAVEGVSGLCVGVYRGASHIHPLGRCLCRTPGQSVSDWSGSLGAKIESSQLLHINWLAMKLNY